MQNVELKTILVSRKRISFLISHGCCDDVVDCGVYHRNVANDDYKKNTEEDLTGFNPSLLRSY